MSQTLRIAGSAGARGRPGVRAAGYTCRAGRKDIGTALRQLFEFRRLLYVFVWRDLRVRYRNTLLGAGWNVLQPLGYLAVFSVVFGVVAEIPRAGDAPYPLFLFPGLLLWQLLARILSLGGSSVDAFRPLLSRVYFPRMLAPLAATLGASVDFAIALSALAVLLLVYQAVPGWGLLLAPVCVALVVALGLGCSLWLAVLDAGHRDVRHTLPFLTQIWLFASPVVYPIALVPEPYRGLYSLNPMASLLEGFRFALVPGAPPPSASMLLCSTAVALALLSSGALYFNAREGTLADDA